MESESPTDAELVTATLAGDREAFGKLYDRHARMVRAVVLGVSADWRGLDDMAQECFLRAYRQLAALRDPQQFGPWIVGIARHVGRERRRSLGRDRHEFREPQPWELESPATTVVAAQEHEEFERVMQKVASLDEEERIAIHAFFLERQDAEQSAALLGLSRSGYYALVQRAVARLAAQLNPQKSNEQRERIKR